MLVAKPKKNKEQVDALVQIVKSMREISAGKDAYDANGLPVVDKIELFLPLLSGLVLLNVHPAIQPKVTKEQELVIKETLNLIEDLKNINMFTKAHVRMAAEGKGSK